MLPAQPNQSLIDGLAVLQALAGSSEAVGSRELSRMLSLEPTRVNRLLKTLAAVGMAEQDAQRRYRPGPGIHVLAAQSLYGSGLIRRALPHLEALHRHGLVVALGVLWHEQVCFVYHGSPGASASDALGKLELQPATQTGVGTMLLAAKTDAQIKTQFKNYKSLPMYKSVAELIKVLRKAREDQAIRVVLKSSPLLATLAVPVGQTRYAAIAFSGSINESDVARLLPQLRQAAIAIDPTSPPADTKSRPLQTSRRAGLSLRIKTKGDAS